MNRPVRVLIVDDSALIQQLLTSLLSADPEIEVVGTAGDPFIARDRIKALNPDVVTLDIEMPRMDGVTFLRKIMALRPMPVIMVSTLTQAAAEITLEALEAGAVDFIAKPTTNVANTWTELAGELQGKVKAAARTRIGVRRAPEARAGAAARTHGRHEQKNRRDRSVDRRRRGLETGAGEPAGAMPANPHYAAYAAALYRGLCRAAQSGMPDDDHRGCA